MPLYPGGVAVYSVEEMSKNTRAPYRVPHDKTLGPDPNDIQLLGRPISGQTIATGYTDVLDLVSKQPCWCGPNPSHGPGSCPQGPHFLYPKDSVSFEEAKPIRIIKGQDGQPDKAVYADNVIQPIHESVYFELDKHLKSKAGETAPPEAPSSKEETKSTAEQTNSNASASEQGLLSDLVLDDQSFPAMPDELDDPRKNLSKGLQQKLAEAGRFQRWQSEDDSAQGGAPSISPILHYKNEHDPSSPRRAPWNALVEGGAA